MLVLLCMSGQDQIGRQQERKKQHEWKGGQRALRRAFYL
jgi:hypothetical protein